MTQCNDDMKIIESPRYKDTMRQALHRNSELKTENDILKRMVGELESENNNLRDIIENCGIDADELLGEE